MCKTERARGSCGWRMTIYAVLLFIVLMGTGYLVAQNHKEKLFSRDDVVELLIYEFPVTIMVASFSGETWYYDLYEDGMVRKRREGKIYKKSKRKVLMYTKNDTLK